MTAIRVIFDGKSFVPQQPVSLAPESEALVIVGETDHAMQDQLDAEVRAYYAARAGDDAEDEAWATATSPQSHRAWDED